MNGEPTGRGLPTWFQALCVQAALRAELAPQVRASYRDPGYHLAIHWWIEVETEDQRPAAEGLRSLDPRDPEAALLGWMQRFLPDFVVRVPARRRRQLARGFMARLEHDGL